MTARCQMVLTSSSQTSLPVCFLLGPRGEFQCGPWKNCPLVGGQRRTKSISSSVGPQSVGADLLQEERDDDAVRHTPGMAKLLVGALLILGQAGCFSGDSRHIPPVGVAGAERWQVGVSSCVAGGDWSAWPSHSLRLRGGSFTNEEGGESAVPLPYGSTRQSMEVGLPHPAAECNATDAAIKSM
jgi:hypothetical protein